MEQRLWGGPYTACWLSLPFPRRVTPPSATPSYPCESIAPDFSSFLLFLPFLSVSAFHFYLCPSFFSQPLSLFLEPPSLSPTISCGSIAPLCLGAFLHCACAELRRRGKECAGSQSQAPPDIPPPSLGRSLYLGESSHRCAPEYHRPARQDRLTQFLSKWSNFLEHILHDVDPDHTKWRKWSQLLLLFGRPSSRVFGSIASSRQDMSG